jgi:catechol 2,3-dioxygenase-like lactoylglutathione lyase family enzyme
MLAVLISVEPRSVMSLWHDALLISMAMHKCWGLYTPVLDPDDRRGKMAFKLNHLHLKTKDPQKTAQFYVDNLGATIVSEIGTRGYRLDLHGLTINLTTHIEDQTRQQLYGMEHFALNTDDLDGTVAKLKANGAQVLEQMTSANGRRICFLEGPDGVQLEIIEAQS